MGGRAAARAIRGVEDALEHGLSGGVPLAALVPVLAVDLEDLADALDPGHRSPVGQQLAEGHQAQDDQAAHQACNRAWITSLLVCEYEEAGHTDQ